MVFIMQLYVKEAGIIFGQVNFSVDVQGGKVINPTITEHKKRIIKD